MFAFLIGWLIVGTLCGYLANCEIDDEAFAVIVQETKDKKNIDIIAQGCDINKFKTFNFAVCIIFGYLSVFMYYQMKSEIRNYKKKNSAK